MAYRASLIRLIPFTEGAGDPVDLISGLSMTLVNGPAWGSNAFGPCVVCSDVAHSIAVGFDSGFLPTTGPITILLIRRKTDTTLRNAAGFGVDGDDSVRCGAFTPFSNSNVYWDFGGQGGPNRVNYGYSVSTAVERFAFSQGPATGKIYQDSGTPSVTGSGQGTRSPAGAMFSINHGSNSNGDLQEINYFAILNEQMSDADVAAWMAAADPVAYFLLPAATKSRLGLLGVS